MKVLFCTDGSKISFDALRNFADWYKKAVVDIICVIDWSFLPDEISIEQIGFADSCANIADTILNFAEKEVKKLNLDIGQKIKHCGNASECILEEAEKDYDLIVMGSHGKKGIQKWLGSVSQDVINNTTKSIYVSRQENSREKILFTTDGSKFSLNLITGILPDINLENKKIHICMVNEEPDLLFLEGTLDTNWLLEIEKRQNLFAEKALREINNLFEKYGCNITGSKILTGNPAQKITDYAKENGIDLIIAGNRKKTKMDKFLSNSVSKRVLENVKSDMLIVKEN